MELNAESKSKGRILCSVPYSRWSLIFATYLACGCGAGIVLGYYRLYGWGELCGFFLFMGFIAAVGSVAYPDYWCSLAGAAFLVLMSLWEVAEYQSRPDGWWLEDGSLICGTTRGTRWELFWGMLPITLLYVGMPLCAWALLITMITRRWRRVGPRPNRQAVVRNEDEDEYLSHWD